MPNTKSAAKRLRQNSVRRSRNRSLRSSVRTEVRKVRRAIAAGDLDGCEAQFRVAARQLDKAASKRAIHANAAARAKSRLSAAIRGLKTG